MAKYLVSWVIDVEAKTPVEAATEAWTMMQDPESLATIFSVANLDKKESHTVDLRFDEAVAIVTDHKTRKDVRVPL